MQLFNENSLYAEIVKVWGESGAHADVFREICKKADIELDELSIEETIEDKIRRLFRETGGNRINTIKHLRFDRETYMSLRSAKELVDRVLGK